jgi:hypothetical protein
MPSQPFVKAAGAPVEGENESLREDHMVAQGRTESATGTVTDLCSSLPRPRRTVDLSPGEMAGAQSDIDVPARRC